MKNTFVKGQIRILIYRDKSEGVWYGTALEFNLTIDGDDKATVQLELNRAIHEYIQSAKEVDSVNLLNQESDPELLALWKGSIENIAITKIESPYIPYLAATEALSMHA